MLNTTLKINEQKISYEQIEQMHLSYLVQDFWKVFLFCVFDVLIILMQGSSSKSIRLKNFTNLNLKKIFIKISFFLFFLTVNYSFLCSIIFFLEVLGDAFKISPKIIMFIVLICLIFRIHSWIQNNLFFILGIFNHRQEFTELFFDGKKILEMDYIQNNDNQLKSLIIHSLKYFRKITYKFVYNDANVSFLALNYKAKHLYRSAPLNKRLLPDFLDFWIRLIIPHGLTILVNHNGVSNYILRTIIYMILSIFRIFYFIKIILYVSTRNVL